MTGGEDDIARLRDLTTADLGATVRLLCGHEGGITTLTISADSHWLVTGSIDGIALLWDLTATDPGATAQLLRGHEWGITTVAINKDNHWLVTGSEDGTARLWDIQTEDLMERVKRIAGRNFTLVEWQLYFPPLKKSIVRLSRNTPSVTVLKNR